MLENKHDDPMKTGCALSTITPRYLFVSSYFPKLRLYVSANNNNNDYKNPTEKYLAFVRVRFAGKLALSLVARISWWDVWFIFVCFRLFSVCFVVLQLALVLKLEDVASWWMSRKKKEMRVAR